MPCETTKKRSKLSYVKHYVFPPLIDETPGRTIFHGGCNNVNNKNSTPEKIANEVGVMEILYRGYGVNDIFISTVICRRNLFSNENALIFY